MRVEVLEHRRRVLGIDHPDTIRAAANLAVTYRSQGRLEEAINLTVLAVELGMRVLGRQHPHTQHFVRVLLQNYADLGISNEAGGTKALLQS
jgi:hypothetical protein